MTTSNTIDIGDAPASVKSESSFASVGRMLKNAVLISVRDSVLLKLAIVFVVVIALFYALFFIGCVIYPHLIGHPCHTQEEYHAFYQGLFGRNYFTVGMLMACMYVFQAIVTFIMNFLMLAMDSEIIRVWNGQKADFMRGWRTAVKHIGAIAAWSVLIAPINGMWIVSMCIVIPLLTRDDSRNPFKMIWRSVLLLLKIWKEFLLGIVGMLVILYWITCTVIGSGVIFNSIASQCPPALAWFLLAVGASFLLVAFCFAILCCNAYLCGQYIKASEGVEPNPEAVPAELA
jgi:hypothetical protein